MIFAHYLERLKQEDFDKVPRLDEKESKEAVGDTSRMMRERCVDAIQFLFTSDDSFGEKAMNVASKMPHVM